MQTGLYIQGIGLGLAAAMPIGPVNVEIIRRGLARGFLAALALGLGAASADMLYLSVVLGGAMRWTQGPTARPLMLGLGGLLLLVLAALALLGARRTIDPAAPAPSAAPGRSYATGLAMTLSNPMTIAYWIGVSARLAGDVPSLGNYLTSLGGVATGTIGWVVAISALTAAGRRWVGGRFQIGINLIGAALLGGYGVHFVISALRAM